MTQIMFGSFATTITTDNHLCFSSTPTPPPQRLMAVPSAPRPSYGVAKARRIMASDQAKQDRAFAIFEQAYNNVGEKRAQMKIVQDTRGRLKLRPKTKQDHKKELKKRAQEEAERKWFLEPPSVVSAIQHAPQVAEPLVEEEKRRPSRAVHVVQKVKVVPKHHFSEEAMHGFMRCIGRIAKKNNLTFEVIGAKRATRGSFQSLSGVMKPRVHVKHMDGVRHRTDCRIDGFTTTILQQFSQISGWKQRIDADSLKPGSSGFVLNAQRLKGNIGRHFTGLFIVRGRDSGVLLDARSRLTNALTLSVDHYTESVGNRFWRGFERAFLRCKPTNLDHICASNFDVEACGAVAGIVCQTIMPCGKITCEQCAKQYANLSGKELQERLTENIRRHEETLRTGYPQFAQVRSFLKSYNTLLSAYNPNYEAFMEIKMLIGERTEAPFSHINKLNEILIKGNSATSEELSIATNHLRELARYQKNRTENIKKGSLQSFRNKVSSKSHINPTLMCDNQLDKNGNFVWGERGYHAKRFFSNYFDAIDPTRGYEQYIIRKFPNGQRELAIGNLIISTNFTTLREQMKGKAVERHPLTKQCVALRNENFVYPCCCVTLDDGTPLESDVKMPTKNHIVVGNTGDSKYVDLPTDVSLRLYIAKPGYCYINIFLAMLVNVNESEAKNFTKMVRDVIVEKLGTWPSMIDVATACYMLTVFHPDTHNAEIPKIFVDHGTKTMHVIDSYGSLNVGYHVLKANTVSQLIQFASDTLDSEMKHYTVGGLQSTDHIEVSSMRLLIRSIYKPALMKTLLQEEPYLLVLSVLSPGVLLALFNSGSLEWAVQEFITRDKELATVVSMLTSLAMKVSLSTTLQEQLHVIETHAATLLDSMHTHNTMHSHGMALLTLERIAARSDTDRTLTDLGFSTLRNRTVELMEKSYLQGLEDAWAELTWCGKFSAIRSSYHWRKFTQKPVRPQNTADLRGRYDISVTSLLTRTHEKVTECVNKRINQVRQVVRSVATGTMSIGFSALTRLVPDIFRFINVLIIVSLFLQISVNMHAMLKEYRAAKALQVAKEMDEQYNQLVQLYTCLERKLGKQPTKDEFVEFVSGVNPGLVSTIDHILPNTVRVEHEAHRDSQANLERVVAFTALVMMMFDSGRSDCVYKVLNKLKGLMNTIEGGVGHQSIDDVQDVLSEKKMTVDFTLDSEAGSVGYLKERTFSNWWANQIEQNNVIPHYRTEGQFMEFTRITAQKVANDIAHGVWKDVLVRGAVGSGKSTALPFHLSQKGAVLMLEPTRPLAENVTRQLRGEPFHVNPTLRMRGMTAFGSTPITVMTSGFALHYFANNPTQLTDYKFIIFDECHVVDCSAMAFRSLIHEYSFDGVVIKASATPPGREKEFETQYPVQLKTEEHLSLQQFVAGQGTGANFDVTQHGDNILVYVASYNEVDTLSKLLLERGFKVTKVDGRTMKVGNVEIITTGTLKLKHFVVATNIIENGVTLDIDVVVDFGTKVVPHLDIDCRMIHYTKTSVSFGERIQRLGRVGRLKSGVALRIGQTFKDLTPIPPVQATEAAFLCFAYGLPVMTNNVSISLLSNCTVRQARTMLQFELPIYYMMQLVRFDGSMHQAIFDIVKQFRLRDSEVQLNKLAIPAHASSSWFTGEEYRKMGSKINIEAETRIPFNVKDIPERMHEKIWEAVKTHRGDAAFGKMSSHSATKIAYTLKTDVHSLQRTIKIIDVLIEQEMEKQSYFKSIVSNTCSATNFSLASITQSIRARYAKDHTLENLGILHAAKAQLLEFQNLYQDSDFRSGEFGGSSLEQFGALECVQHESQGKVSHQLGLKGKWDAPLASRDILILAGVVCGGAWMVYEYYKEKFNEVVVHQGYNKRQRQKLKFRNARDVKNGREIYGDDGTIEHYFGSAYTKKGKTKGTTRGMGTKNRRFINMYGYDPADFSFVRFVDPLTGATLDDSPYTDINLVQEHFTDVRLALLEDDKLDSQHLRTRNNIEAYYIKNATSNALKVDLTPHNPLMMGANSISIAGFPERQGELRQTGAPVLVSFDEVPQKNETQDSDVEHEGSGLAKGMRDYNPIAKVICQLVNDSDGHRETMFGIGYGSLIITNQHLFKRNNGQLIVRSMHGEFTIKNTQTLKVYPCKGRDIILIQLPKDFSPFPQRLTFREPHDGEKVCLIGSNFQERHITSTVSETSATYSLQSSHFWKHWIETKHGYCGLPIVSTSDGAILGLHSLANFAQTQNYYAAFPNDFKAKFLNTPEQHEWLKQWKYNADEVCWGSLKLRESAPEGLFKVSKLVSDLFETDVFSQSRQDKWLFNSLHGNVKAVASCPSQLVTKHVVQGKCQMFDMYLRTHPEESTFFTPLLGAYQKSKLNKEAYTKDLMKYATPLVVGDVDCDSFTLVVEGLGRKLRNIGMQTCNYVTDTESIFSALNMKAATGALYRGKKKDYFAEFTNEDKDQILKESCFRLYTGKLGIWNGSLKAELRSAEKVEQNKTRTFTAAPIDTLLGGKVCVDDFNNQFYDFHFRAPWSVGMSKFNCGWDELLRGLPEGWIYCDADGSQFDSSLSPFLINAVLNLRISFMEDWDIGEQMLKNLYTEIVYTPISTPDGTVVKKFKGNNSGQPSTVVDNTLMVVLAMMYSLLQLGVTLEEQDDICKYFVNGDDLLIAIEPSKEHLLDSMGAIFLTLGLKYDFSSRHKSREGVCFMSHMGMLKDGLYIPKLDQERIVSILEWDRATKPEHRLEAICAAMIESWGYTELTHRIRKFYQWVLEQAPYNELAREGKAPYIAESALRCLYTSVTPTQTELEHYLKGFNHLDDTSEELIMVAHQADERRLDAGKTPEKQKTPANNEEPQNDKDVNVGTSGTIVVPRLKAITNKLAAPKFKGKSVLNFDHLLGYTPDQTNISNTRSTQQQFNTWYSSVMAEYGVGETEMSVILNGLMVWCIENGTSPNINGMWVMMDGEEQVEFPIKPLIDHAKPTFRQIMAHFSNVAEAYIEKRNYEKPYMPRYGLQRNLNDMSLARYAFDFYEVTSKTPVRAREACAQMKAAALRGASTKLFGLDGNVGTKEEDTERHTAEDVNRNMHSLLGVRNF